MSLVKCSECGAQVSTQASACPQCGARRTPAPRWGRVVVALLIGLALFYWLGTTAPAWDAGLGAPAASP